MVDVGRSGRQAADDRHLTVAYYVEPTVTIMAQNGKYITLTDDNFEAEVLESDQPVLVDFWAEWCGPCKMLEPVVEELAEAYEGRAKIGKLDVDANSEVAMKYNIRSIPSLIFFKGGEVEDQVVGVAPKKKLAKKLDELVEA